jgi:hypothetical protein
MVRWCSSDAGSEGEAAATAIHALKRKEPYVLCVASTEQLGNSKHPRRSRRIGAPATRVLWRFVQDNKSTTASSMARFWTAGEVQRLQLSKRCVHAVMVPSKLGSARRCHEHGSTPRKWFQGLFEPLRSRRAQQEWRRWPGWRDRRARPASVNGGGDSNWWRYSKDERARAGFLVAEKIEGARATLI